MMKNIDPFLLTMLGLIVPGLLTGVGAIPVFFTRNVSQGKLDVFLGAAAGVMLSATCFSLILPSIEENGGGFRGVIISSLGILAGAVFLDIIVEGNPSDSLKKIWLFVIAITIHNFPEGMATGVGFGGDSVANGLPIAIGIGLQNMPEGLAVALSLVRENYTVKKAFLIALFTGLVEPIGAFLGYGLVTWFSPILGFILAFAGGAMLFVISDEIIPETHSNGYERQATYGIVIGFIIMMILDVALG